MFRALAAGSLIFTGLSRLPMTAGWDRLLPAWFTDLHPRWKTPVNSIVFVAGLVMLVVILSMLGVHEQEANQLLQGTSSAHYALVYVALFAIPLLGSSSLRRRLPRWLWVASLAGLGSSLIAVLIAVYPIIEVSNRSAYAAKIGGALLISNVIGVTVYRSRSRTES